MLYVYFILLVVASWCIIEMAITLCRTAVWQWRLSQNTNHLLLMKNDGEYYVFYQHLVMKRLGQSA